MRAILCAGKVRNSYGTAGIFTLAVALGAVTGSGLARGQEG